MNRRTVLERLVLRQRRRYGPPGARLGLMLVALPGATPEQAQAGQERTLQRLMALDPFPDREQLRRLRPAILSPAHVCEGWPGCGRCTRENPGPAAAGILPDRARLQPFRNPADGLYDCPRCTDAVVDITEHLQWCRE